MDTTTKYVILIEQFLDDNISSKEFERKFIKKRNKDLSTGNNYSKILSKFFIDIDAFCSNTDLFEEGDLTEQDLRESCKRTLAALKLEGY